ncbi:hypothetical protein HYU06_06395 [Candidatus Woesearchaeota archaeon]|nr:hypothetical protein [Candidatus Woesearchaeota archaeon]
MHIEDFSTTLLWLGAFIFQQYMHSKIYEAAAAVGTLSFGRKVAPPLRSDSRCDNSKALRDVFMNV